MTCTCAGATFAGQTRPLGSWFASASAATTRETPMPYEPMVTTTDLPFSSRTVRPSAAEYLRPSAKMWPISIPRASSSGPDPSGARSPARTSAASIDAVGGEVPPRDQAEHVLARDVGAGDPCGAGYHARVQEVTDVRPSRPSDAGADVALDQLGVPGEVGVARGLDLGGRHGGLEPLEVDLAVAGQPDHQDLPPRRPGA